MLTEQEVLQKWGNGIAKRDISLSKIFYLCRDIMVSRTDESSWKEPEPVVLQTADNAEYDWIAFRYERLIESGKVEGIWIYSLEKGEQETEITSSILIERDFRRGKERFNVYTPPIPFYAPLVASDLAEDSLLCITLNPRQRKTLFLGVKGAFLATVLAENDQPASA